MIRPSSLLLVVVLSALVAAAPGVALAALQDAPPAKVTEPALETDAPVPIDAETESTELAPALPAGQDPFATTAGGGGATSGDPSEPREAAAPKDPEIERVQAPARQALPAGEVNPLPSAKEPPGGLPASLADGAANDPFILPADRLPTGPNAVGLTVEVRAPEVSNLHVDNVFYVRIRNTGPGDAMGVGVRYQVPENVEFVDAEPSPAATGPIVWWQLNGMPTGSERTIKVKVRPKTKGTFDHAVTVALMAGGRARTMVRQPQLRVELRPDKTKPLKGEPVVFEINVTNTGDHPAREVEVRARLSPGLGHPKGTDLALKLNQELGLSTIEPGQSVPLRLEVDTTGMGLQSCDVTALSPDIPGEAQARSEIEVVAPDLQLSVEGPTTRYPDNVATYRLTVTNAGTSPARDVVVAAQVPTTGKPEGVNPRGVWKSEVRTYYWRVPELPPQATEVFTIQVRMGAIGLFTLTTGAKAQGVPPVKKTHSTDIQGVSKLAMSVTEPRGVLDEGEESTYEIRIRNEGSREAVNLQIKGVVSDNLQVLSVTGADPKLANPAPPDPQTAVFPLVDRLPPGGEISLSFKVRAVKSGNGTCAVTVLHDDIPVPISQSMVTRVTPASGAVNR
jgi:uncharacterized repeat protein (TIGR01451 family)